MTKPRRVVLIGAGHAHLHALKHAAEFARRGAELVVIAPENFWYSGLATGMLGGGYPPELDQIDVARLLTAGRFVCDRVTRIDSGAQVLQLATGKSLGFDVLSVNVGSETRPIAGAADGVFPIKPLRELWRLRRELEQARDARRPVTVIIAGGGASGCEIAANIHALMAGAEATITVLARGDRVVASFGPRIAARLQSWLAGRGIEIRTHSAIDRIDGRIAITSRGDALPFDFLVNATGLHPPPLLAESGLPCTPRGELLLDQWLRSVSGAPIFGGGDCVAMRGRELEKIGVYAVRQAPVILHNLRATLDGTPLREFRPQRHCLLILNLGGGIGLARWRGLHWLGRAAFWWKDMIDRRFLERYRRPAT